MTTDTTAKSNDIPKRSEIDAQYKWNLADIFESDDAWEGAFKEAEELIAKIAKFAGHLTDSPESLYECLETRSQLQQKFSALYQYAALSRDLDNRVSRYQAMTDRIAMLAAKGSAALSFIEPELLNIDEKKLLGMSQQFPKTDVFDFYIRDLIRSKAHVRSHEVEEVLAMSAMVARGPDNIFTMLDDADMKYPSIVDEDGNEVQLTKQRFARFMESKDRRVRRDANHAFYSSYRDHLNTIGASLSSSVSSDVFYSRVRHYESCLHNALDGHNIPTSVYHNLLDSTEEHIEALHRYATLRKKVLKLDEVYPYDMVCPLFPDYDFEVPYDEAVATIQEAVKPLGQDYVDVLKSGFESRWIDVYETEGKGSGAYSFSDNVNAHPFVLMNYNDTVDNMFTLAHEMGHALHSYLANKTQPHPKARYAIFVAEVASTLNEGLLLNYLLDKVKDKGERLYLLDRQLSNTMGTFFHQIMYARFELLIHKHVEAGGALSPDFMNELWADLTKKYYGPELVLDDDTPLKWSRIPHFYRMFYVYQYATSFAASQMILTKFVDGEPGIIDKYLKMLAAGGSDYPIELLKICGVDMTQPDAVMATIKIFGDLVTEMDQLT